MGRSVLLVMFAAATVMIGSLLWLNGHRDSFRSMTLAALNQDFEASKSQILQPLTHQLTLRVDQNWEFDFNGDELWVQAPELLKEAGSPSPEDFESARSTLQSGLEEWLSKKPGDSNRFPLRLKFKNENEVLTR